MCRNYEDGYDCFYTKSSHLLVILISLKGFFIKEGRITYMDNISFLLAFSAGLLSFLSPCVLPLIPAYVSYLTGAAVSDINTGRDKLSLLYKSIGFAIGFSLVFIVLGASVSAIGKLFSSNLDILRKAGGIITIILGLHMTGLFKIRMLYSEKRLLPLGKNPKSISSIFVGMAFAAGWTPCIGPILSSILIYAGSMATIGKGIFLLVMYSLGLAVPFLLTAVAIGSFSKYLKKISKYLPVISVISGILMIAMGVLVFTNRLTILSRYLNFINF